MNTIKYKMPVLLVKDISISKKFYQDIFSLETEHDFGANIVFKDTISLWQKNSAGNIIFNDESKIELIKNKNLELYFESDDIEKFHEELIQKSINLIHGLKEEPWGQRTIRFFDPDNFIIEIAEPVEGVVSRLFKSGLSHEEISKKTQLPLKIVKKILK